MHLATRGSAHDLHDEDLSPISTATQQAPEAAELMLLALSASAYSSRRSSVCRPFPDEVLSPGISNERNYTLLREALQALPSVAKMDATDQLRELPKNSLYVLRWLLTRRSAVTRAFRIRHATIEELRMTTKHAVRWPDHQNPSLTPTTVLAFDPREVSNPGVRGIEAFGFHGTSLENLHSILSTGLLNASGTHLQTTGANHGGGIYCSTDMCVAFSFSKPASVGAWRGCTLGNRLRVVLLYQVDPAAVSKCRDLPDHYMLLQASQEAQLRYCLLFDDSVTRPLDLTDPTIALVLLYAMILIALWIFKSFL